MRKIRALAASLAVMTAACTAGERETEPTTDTSEALEQSLVEEGVTVVQATLSEWKIALSQDSIPAGAVAFQVRNDGSAEHALEVEASQGDGEWETDRLKPGGSVTMSLNLEPGVYEVYCPVDVAGTKHSDQGMRTRLRVY